MLWVLIRSTSVQKICCGYSLEAPQYKNMLWVLIRSTSVQKHMLWVLIRSTSVQKHMLWVLIRRYSLEAPHWGAPLMCTHNICFCGEIRKIPALLVDKHALSGLCGSVGCAVRLETRRSRVQPPPRSATFFRGDWSWNIFYGHSLPSADSRRAVVSFWAKECAQYWLTA